MAARADGLVYFVTSPDAGGIKIGCSVNPANRVALLQRTSAVRLRLAGTAPGGWRAEHMLHIRYARWRMYGEWFKSTTELRLLIAFVQRHQRLPKNLDTLLRNELASRTRQIRRFSRLSRA